VDYGRLPKKTTPEKTQKAEKSLRVYSYLTQPNAGDQREKEKNKRGRKRMAREVEGKPGGKNRGAAPRPTAIAGEVRREANRQKRTRKDWDNRRIRILGVEGIAT